MLVDTRDGSYLLGVIHGDGHVSERSVSISIGRDVPFYAEMIMRLTMRLGYKPRLYAYENKCLRIDIHSTLLAKEARAYKGIDLWEFPQLPRYPEDYLSGLIDTDGYVPNGQRYRINITQKAGPKLPKIRPILDALGFSHIEIVRRTENRVRGKRYPIDLVWWNTQDDVLLLADKVCLRHDRKAQYMIACVARIHELRRTNKSYQILRLLRENGGLSIPEIVERSGLNRGVVLQTLDSLRRQSRVTRNDPPIDSLVWNWVDTNLEGE